MPWSPDDELLTRLSMIPPPPPEPMYTLDDEEVRRIVVDKCEDVRDAFEDEQLVDLFRRFCTTRKTNLQALCELRMNLRDTPERLRAWLEIEEPQE